MWQVSTARTQWQEYWKPYSRIWGRCYRFTAWINPSLESCSLPAPLQQLKHSESRCRSDCIAESMHNVITDNYVCNYPLDYVLPLSHYYHHGIFGTTALVLSFLSCCDVQDHALEKVYVARVLGRFPEEPITTNAALDWDPIAHHATAVHSSSCSAPQKGSAGTGEQCQRKLLSACTAFRLLAVASDGLTSLVECRCGLIPNYDPL